MRQVRDIFLDTAEAFAGIAGRQWLAVLIAGAAAYGVGVAATEMLEFLGDAQIAMIAIAFALFVGLVLESARGVIRSARAIEREAGLAVLATVPTIHQREMNYVAPDQRVPYRFSVGRSNSEFAAAVRTLRRNASPRAGTIAIVPVAPNDGGSTLAMSIAAAGWMENQSVVVIDCDRRRRSVTRLAADFTETIGSSDVMIDPVTEVHVLPMDSLLARHRDFVTTPEFASLIETLRSQYDLVILDCPPALIDADTRIVSRLADLSILVVRRNKTTVGDLTAAAKSLRRARVQIAGVALNGML